MHTRLLLLAGCLIISGSLRVVAQSRTVDLSLDESLTLLQQANPSIRLADKQIDIARAQRGGVNSLWYPTLSLSGAYFHFVNKIEVSESMGALSNGRFAQMSSELPDGEPLKQILEGLDATMLTVPIAPQNVTSIDLNISWPLFLGGRRLNATKAARSAVALVEENRREVDAGQQTALVECYFALRLGKRVVEVQQATLAALEQHYRNALRLEEAGMIDRAERLVAQVNMQQAESRLVEARNDLMVIGSALGTLIGADSVEINPTTPLFICDDLPPIETFKQSLDNNYAVRQLDIQSQMIESQLRIDRGAYLPEIAVFGRQTLYSHGISKNYIPRTIFGAGMSWTLFDGLGREKGIKQTRGKQQSIAIARQRATDDLEVVIDKFYTQLLNAASRAATLGTTIELSRELVRMRRKAFAEGMATSTEVVDAEVMLSGAEVALLLCYYSFDTALINLLTTCGRPELFDNYSRGIHHTATDAVTG